MYRQLAKTITRKQADLLLVAHIFKTDAIIGTRDVVNFAHAREAGVTDKENVRQATENEGECYLITVKFPRQVPPQISSHYN